MSIPEETAASRYVKLNKGHEQAVEEVRPGELNQPVFVPELVTHRCNECGQPLPESYELPGTESSSSGIFGCWDNMDSCKGSSAHVYSLDGTWKIGRRKFLLEYNRSRKMIAKANSTHKNSLCDPCMVHCCLHWCAICQEHREMQGHLSDSVVMPMRVINPPPHQHMDAQESATVSHKEDTQIQTSS